MGDSKRLIGQRISVLRKAKGLTQSELAEKVALDSRHISRLETGRYYPSLESLEAIAEALEAELVDFFSFPQQESTEEMRGYLIEIAHTASEGQIRELVPMVRNILGRRRRA